MKGIGNCAECDCVLYECAECGSCLCDCTEPNILTTCSQCGTSTCACGSPHCGCDENGVEVSEDEKQIGTSNYRGIAFFWNMEYKHTLRDVTRKERKRVHDAWLAAGLELNGKSEKHWAIIRQQKEKTMSTKVRECELNPQPERPEPKRIRVEDDWLRYISQLVAECVQDALALVDKPRRTLDERLDVVHLQSKICCKLDDAARSGACLTADEYWTLPLLPEGDTRANYRETWLANNALDYKDRLPFYASEVTNKEDKNNGN